MNTKRLLRNVMLLTLTLSFSFSITSCSKDEDMPKVEEAKYGIPEPVDLGLSVKWANMNIGANLPGEFGSYFAWGETAPKAIYDWNTYKFLENGVFEHLTKYCANSSQGKVDGKNTLEPEDDAAHVLWGGNWRMPTETEMEELCRKCRWETTRYNGVKGVRVTGPSGKSIFLPAAGYRIDSEFRASDEDYHGTYWSSSLAYDNSNNATSFYFYVNHFTVTNDDLRRIGKTIRPVCQ